jgi:hypothetical protein
MPRDKVRHLSALKALDIRWQRHRVFSQSSSALLQLQISSPRRLSLSFCSYWITLRGVIVGRLNGPLAIFGITWAPSAVPTLTNEIPKRLVDLADLSLPFRRARCTTVMFPEDSRRVLTFKGRIDRCVTYAATTIRMNRKAHHFFSVRESYGLWGVRF